MSASEEQHEQPELTKAETWLAWAKAKQAELRGEHEPTGEPSPGAARTRAAKRWGLAVVISALTTLAWTMSRSRGEYVAAAGLIAAVGAIIAAIISGNPDRTRPQPDLALPPATAPAVVPSTPPPADTTPPAPTPTPSRQETSVTTTPATGVLVLAERDVVPMWTEPTATAEPAAPTTTPPAPPTTPPSFEPPAPPPSPDPTTRCHGSVQVPGVLDLCLSLDIELAAVPRG
ncbi:hypothetical protein [Saccharopolyspora antimicrobica]|uniref:hypothetical protein n=1 Tax=Saccharopolyspora antimicrobica TaxID=455193 RepID=UPI00116038CC|nr:hypothetical protein [Saccharopolyspora antimicrobica]